MKSKVNINKLINIKRMDGDIDYFDIVAGVQ